jgi:hypothetical protein
MARLGRIIVEALVLEFGRDEVLRRLAHPFWFQSFGAVMGMDWHSSGITTSVIGALKRGLAPVSEELGLYVCGGRGRHSRKTPDELLAVGERTGVDGVDLARASRLVAKVDNVAVQDGFQIYIHAFVASADGRWAVVQQGMDGSVGYARRYHWLSEGVRRFDEAPHAAIEGPRRDAGIRNLTDRRAGTARDGILGLAHQGAERMERAIREARRARRAPESPHLALPGHHDVRDDDVDLRRLHGGLAAAAAAEPEDFPELLLAPGLGPRTMESLALVAEVLYGQPSRFDDPARFSLAHGGKDGHPFPVPLKVYDQTIRMMRSAVDRARLGNDDRLAATRRLDAEARRLEAVAGGESLAAYIERERRMSHHYGGMTVMGPARPPQDRAQQRKPPRTGKPSRTRKAQPAQPTLPGF